MRLSRLVFLAVLAGCGGSASQRADLIADLRGYGDGIRWRDFNAAALRVPPAKREDFMDDHEQLEDDLRVADWELRRLQYDSTRNHAEVHVEWTWMLDSRGIVHNTVSRQLWSRFGKQWIMMGEERLRGDRMPGMAEPKPKKRRRKAPESKPEPALSATSTRG